MKNPWDNLYPVVSDVTQPVLSQDYPFSSRLELNLRKEMERLLYGAIDEIAKGRIGLLRKMRRDEDGNRIKCSCRDTITDEPDRDHYCRGCLGAGFLWDERKLVYYKNDDSLRRHQEVFFYFEYFIEPSLGDYIVELVRDTEGSVTPPGKREKLYRILQPEAFRADTGRLEYWRCRTQFERNWSVYYDVPSRQHDPTSRS